MPVIKCFAEFEPQQILNIDEVDSLLTINNPAYEEAKRFGGIYAEVPDKYLTFSYFSEEVEGNVLLPRNFHRVHPELFVNPIAVTYKCFEGRRIATKTFKPKFTASFEGERKYQQDFIDGVDFEKERDVLYEVPCGHGKTILGLHNIITRGVASFVLVPTYQIAEQWLHTVKTYSNLNAMVADPVKFHKTDFTGVHVLIMSFDLFDARKDKFPKGFSELWGHVLLDEAHVVGAPTYQPVLELVPSMYRTALTATFRRGDGMDEILQYHFGKKYTMENQFPSPEVYPVLTNEKWAQLFALSSTRGSKRLQRKKDEFTPQQQNINLLKRWLGVQDFYWKIYAGDILEIDANKAIDFDKVKWGDIKGEDQISIRKMVKDIKDAQYKNTATVESFMVLKRHRNAVLLHLAKIAIESGRKVLVISKRRKQLERLAKVFQRQGYKTGLLVSDKNSRSSDYLNWVRREAQITFGIYQLAKQGLDVDALDTLILLHPLKDIEQPAGRINRILPGKKKKNPVIVYPWDNMPMAKNMYSACMKTTRNCDFKMPMTFNEVASKL